MAGKLTAVFAKKEAEAYCSQGLHQEALRLYQNLLSSSPNLGDSFKDAIQGQVNAIQNQLGDSPTQENHMLTAPEIRRIRKGWGANASTADILVCVQAFCQVGHYQEALSEAAKLLQKGCGMEQVMGLFAECLVHLRTPEQLHKTIAPMGKKIFDQLETRCRFYLALTEEMVSQKQIPHAQALYQYLQTDPVISQKAPQRLAAIAQHIDQLASDAPPEVQAQEPDAIAADAEDPSVEPPSEARETSSTKASKKKRFGWLPFFKKRNPENKES